MDYELAKQLKDAGFPRKQISVIVGNEDQFIPDPTHLDQYLYVPILEELIEACGDGDDGINRIYRVRGGWAATGNNDFKDGTGATPSEAVARLWLALNKK